MLDELESIIIDPSTVNERIDPNNPFYLKGSEASLISKNKDARAANVYYAPERISTFYPTIYHKYVMSGGFTGCYFIVEKKNGQLYVYHLSQGGIKSKENRIIMADYIRGKIQTGSNFWGLNPYDVSGIWKGYEIVNGEPQRKKGYRSVVCVSDINENVFVYKTYWDMHNFYDVYERIGPTRVYKNFALARNLETR